MNRTDPQNPFVPIPPERRDQEPVNRPPPKPQPQTR